MGTRDTQWSGPPVVTSGARVVLRIGKVGVLESQTGNNPCDRKLQGTTDGVRVKGGRPLRTFFLKKGQQEGLEVWTKSKQVYFSVWVRSRSMNDPPTVYVYSIRT